MIITDKDYYPLPTDENRPPRIPDLKPIVRTAEDEAAIQSLVDMLADMKGDNNE